ncbi:MAG: hypothetical protein AAFP26_03420 [Planctomycetota bacterium]
MNLTRLTTACAALVAAVGIAGTPQQAIAESGTVQLSDIPEQLPLPLDRRPMYFIQTFGAERDSDRHPDENEGGVAEAFRGPEGVDWFVDEIREGYALGARRFFVNHPGGGTNFTDVTGAAWLTVPEDKRARMTTMIPDSILDEFEEEIEIMYFIGSTMRDPREFEGRIPGQTPDPTFTFYDEHELALDSLRITVGGLMSAGADAIALDAAARAPVRDQYVQFAHEMANSPFKLKVVGEAIPLVWPGDGGEPRIHYGYARRMPWVATNSFIERNFPNNRSVRVNVRQTELYVWVSNHSLLPKADSQKFRKGERWQADGLIVITSEPNVFAGALEAYNRWADHTGIQPGS